MGKNTLELWFRGESEISLHRVKFSHTLLEIPQEAIRGKVTGGNPNLGTFTWSSAVRALSILLLNTSASHNDSGNVDFALVGGSGSAAASLDYALSRQSNWLIDMFGCDASGLCIARRVIHRTNPERKRPGPVELRLNLKSFPAGSIQVHINDVRCNDAQQLIALGSHLESYWSGKDTTISLWRTQEQSTASDRVAETSKETRDEATPNQLPPNYPWPFDKESNRLALHELLRVEVQDILLRRSIFSKQHCHDAVGSLSKDEVFNRYAGNPGSFFSDWKLSLKPAQIFGASNEDPETTLRSSAGKPIRVYMPAGATGPLVLFYYLKHFKGYPIEPHYRFLHAGTVLERILSKEYDPENDISILSAGHLTHLLGTQMTKNYGLVTLLPPNSFQIVAPKNYKRAAGSSISKPKVSGEIAVLSGLTSSSRLYYEHARQNGLVISKKAKLKLAEPDQVTASMLDPNSTMAAIQWFPYYSFSQRICGAQLLDTSNLGLNYKDNLAVAPSDFLRQQKRRAALEVAVRDAWLSLLESSELLSKVLAHLSSNPDYLRFLTRSSGLTLLRYHGGEKLQNLDLGETKEAVAG